MGFYHNHELGIRVHGDDYDICNSHYSNGSVETGIHAKTHEAYEKAKKQLDEHNPEQRLVNDRIGAFETTTLELNNYRLTLYSPEIED